jgi:hypothetical protein
MIRKGKRARYPIAVAMMLSVALSESPAAAVPVLDQSFTSPGSLFMVINEACTYAAQTFTAGVTGTLTGVRIDVQSNPDAPPLRVAIRKAVYNRPSGAPLGVQYLADPDAPLSRLITFDQQIGMLAGHHYAIVVKYRGAEAGVGGSMGGWDGGADNEYVRGRAVSGDCSGFGGPGFWHVWPSYDLHFRTYVEPIS